MPELIEAEAYARAARQAVGSVIEHFVVNDPSWVRGGLSGQDVGAALDGTIITEVDRVGKVVVVQTDGPSVALRFGMTGRLLWDGDGPIDALIYGPKRADEAWVRCAFRLRAPDGTRHRLAVEDARRLGSLELDADLSQLGPDAARLTIETLAGALGNSRTPLKAALLDQRRVAGLGNLLCDETLWRVGLHPARPAGSLDPPELSALCATISEVLADLGRRGGSHTGDLQPQRRPGGVCPRDSASLL